MERYLKLCKGDKQYLLTRSDSRLHIITADNRLELETENWLLSAPCMVAEMNKRQLSRFSMELSRIRGVSVGGLEAGNIIQLYLPQGKKRYQLAEDAEQAAVDALFSDLEWFTPPKFTAQEDWKLKHQRKELRRKPYPLGMAVSLAAIPCVLLLWFFGFRAWPVAAANLLLVLACLTLYPMYPHYFTIFVGTIFRKNNGMDLSWPLWMCPLVLGLKAFGYCKIFHWWKATLMGIPILIALAVLFWKRCPDFRDGKRLVCFLLTGLLLCGGPVLGANILLDFGPVESIRTEILETEREHGGRGADRYYLHVQIQGETVRIPISGRQFRELETGGRVEIEIHIGALGIAYATYFP